MFLRRKFRLASEKSELRAWSQRRNLSGSIHPSHTSKLKPIHFVATPAQRSSDKVFIITTSVLSITPPVSTHREENLIFFPLFSGPCSLEDFRCEHFMSSSYDGSAIMETRFG